MPTEQNNESNDRSSERVWRLKMFLIFGPYVFAFIPIILCICMLVKMSAVQSYVQENNDAISGVVLQQRDISEQVYKLSDRQIELDEQISRLIEESEQTRAELQKYHPSAFKVRDPEALPKKVYLTFDDGPSPNTTEILDILNRYGVKATFFTVGKEAEAYKELYKRIVEEGHTLGMHSYSHVYDEIYESKESFTEDLDKISDFIEEITGVKPTYYRFPGGSNNSLIGDKFEEFDSVLFEKGITYFDWNISTGDATNPALSADEIVKNALTGIDEYEEVVILMHDLGNKDTTVDALPVIIERLQSENIPIEAINESTKLIQYH